MKNEGINTSIANNPKQSLRVLAANEWSQLPDSLLLGVMKTFQIEKFLREFSFSSICSLNILHSACRFLIKWFLMKEKACKQSNVHVFTCYREVIPGICVLSLDVDKNINST